MVTASDRDAVKEALQAELVAGDRYDQQAAKLMGAGDVDGALHAAQRARESDAHAAALLTQLADAWRDETAS